MKNLKKKREQEKEVIRLMIQVYCSGNKHGSGKELCEGCNELFHYASLRIDKCPFMETKTFCSNCKVHCYRAEKREEIKKVMRYAGPRIIFRHPILVLRHMYLSLKEKRKMKNDK